MMIHPLLMCSKTTRKRAWQMVVDAQKRILATKIQHEWDALSTYSKTGIFNVRTTLFDETVDAYTAMVAYHRLKDFVDNLTSAGITDMGHNEHSIRATHGVQMTMRFVIAALAIRDWSATMTEGISMNSGEARGRIRAVIQCLDRFARSRCQPNTTSYIDTVTGMEQAWIGVVFMMGLHTKCDNPDLIPVDFVDIL